MDPLDQFEIMDATLRPLIANSTTSTMTRQALAAAMGGYDTCRNFYKECGYPFEISLDKYRRLYDREGVARRVVDVYPDECWAIPCEVYESEKLDETTPFEEAWAELTANAQSIDKPGEVHKPNALHYLHRVDRVSGIGHFGLLFLGLDDGLEFDQPVVGIEDDGSPSDVQANHKLLYLRTFDQTLVRIDKWVDDRRNPRFGQPEMYSIKFADPKVDGAEGTGTGRDFTEKKVHWTRVIHVADNRNSSETYGTPRMQDVYNRLHDIHKVLAGSAEMFWKGGFPGLSLEVNPNLPGNVKVNQETIKEEMQEYGEGLKRWLALTGMSVKSLAPNVASPEDHLRGQLMAITLAIGVPMRVFIGSEEAKLSSTQDALTWAKRLDRRRSGYLTPMVVRPFIDRLIIYGVLPRPKSYKVYWADLNTTTEEEKAKIALAMAQAMAAYVAGNVESIITPVDFLIGFMGVSREAAENYVNNALKAERLTHDPAELELELADRAAAAKAAAAKKKPASNNA